MRNPLDEWLFANAVNAPGVWAWLRRQARLPYALIRDLLGGKLNLYAMSLVYATLLAIIPLLAFSFSIMKALGVHHAIQPLVRQFFSPMGSAGDELTERVMQFADRVHSGVVGSVGLALLIWTLIGTIKKLEDSVNFVWHVDVSRSFARRIAEYLGLLLLGPTLIAAVITLSRLAANSTPLRLLTALPLLDRMWALWLHVAPYLVASGLLTVLYIIIPNTRVRPRPALVGGIVAGVCWAAVGWVFTLFVLYSTRMTVVYAGFAIIAAALVWTYLGWVIFLLGALVSFYIQNPAYLRLGLRELRLSGADTERLALSIMYLVASSHHSGAVRWSVETLAPQLGFPGVAVARLCAALKDTGLLINSGDGTLLPARDIAQIRLADILKSARHLNSGRVDTGRGTPTAVQEVFNELEAAALEFCGQHVLSEMLDHSPPIVMASISSEPVRIAP